MKVEQTPTIKMVSGPVLCRLLMISAAWLTKMVADGWVPKAGKNAYPLVGATQGYLKYLQSAERRASRSATLSRVQTARARQIELQIARDTGELMAADEAVVTLNEIVGILRDEMNTLAACIRDKAMRTRLQAEVDQIFGAAAERIKLAAANFKGGGNADNGVLN
jgi:hypothetical protein